MRITQYQSNFSTGEIDPLLRARTDLQQYQNALEEATNVIVQPQGGISRRDGLKFVHSFSTSFTDFKLIPFEFSVSDSYLLVFVVGRIYVFKSGTLQTNINGSGNDYITATDITAAMLDELEYTQAVDTLILCHEDLQTKRLVRNSDTSWTLENLPLTNPPQYAYALDEHSPNFTITPSATTGNITITASSVTTDNGTAQAGTADTITLKTGTSPYSSDDDANGLWITLTAGTGSGQERYISDWVASTKVATVYPAWTTQPDNTTQYKVAAFAASAINNFAQVENTFGRVKYIEYVSDTIMNAVVEVPFFDTSGVVAGNWIGEFGYEDVWSSTRGWPRSATFHEGRLYFGGSKSRPNTVWGSRVIDYFNFDSHTGLDDEAVETTINTNQLNSIVNIVSGADLRIFSTGGEFIVVQSEDTPITPSNFLVRPQTRLGAKAGVPIEDLNGATIFVQRQGKSINAFQFGSETNSYQVQNISLLSSHLLNTPVDLAARRASSTDESDRLFVVNSGDGSMAVYSILVGQNVIAPSKFTTDGTFEAIAVELQDVYVIVKRTINSVDNYFLEVFDSSLTLDSAKTGTSASSVDMSHLLNKTVKLISDGDIEADQTAAASPLNFTFAPTTSFQAGLDYTVQAKTMPTEPTLASGSLHGVRKRVVQVDSLLDSSQNLKINSKVVSFDRTSSAAAQVTINNATYDSKFFQVPDPYDNNDSDAVSFRFKSDGSLLFVLDDQIGGVGSGWTITQFTLATPWDISTATNQTIVESESLLVPNVKGFDFSADGTKVFYLEEDSQEIVQYNLTKAWDLTTGLKVNANTFDFSSIGSNNEQSFVFSQNGLRAYIVSGSDDRIYQLNLTEAFDGSTFSDASKTLDVSAKLSFPHGVAISADGKKIFVTGRLDTTIEEYTLSTAYELDSASHTASYTVPHATTESVHEIVLKPDNTRFYVLDSKTVGFTTTNYIYQHTPVTKLSPVSEYTGLKTAHGLLGYANTGQITLTQTEPLAMTVLGLEYKLSTGS